MKLVVLLCLAGNFGWAGAIPLERLEKVSMDFFLNNSMVVTTTMSTSFIVNIPTCVLISKFRSPFVRVAVAQLPDSSTLPGVTDTDQIVTLHKAPHATTYFAGEFNRVSCRTTRDIVVMGTENSQYELTSVLGYQVGAEFCLQTTSRFCNQALKPSTFYRVNYFFFNTESQIKAHTGWSPAIQTRTVIGYESADVAFAGRAGGMIVITILVSIGGLVLLLAFTAAVILSNKK